MKRKTQYPPFVLILVLTTTLLGITSPSTPGVSAHTVVPLAQESWPQVQYDARHSGYVSQTVTGPFTELWRRDLFPVSSRVQPIIAEGLVFLPSNDQSIYALRTSNGSVAWSYKTNGALVNSAGYENGRVFFGSTDHFVYALQAGNGAFIWKYETGDTVKTAPVLAEGRVFIGSSDGYFYALNQSDGSLAWTQAYHVGAPIYDTAAYDNGRVFFGGMDSVGYALNAADGSLAWKLAIRGQGFRDRWTVAGNGKAFFTPMLIGKHSDAQGDGTVLFSTDANPIIYDQPWSVQRQAILAHLASHPYQQPLFVVDQSTGSISYTPPVLYASGGSESPHSQPVLLPNGNANVIYRRSFGEPAHYWATTSDALYTGELVLATGDITPVDTCVPGSGGWINCGQFKSAIISDESAALVRSGDVIYIDNSRGTMGLDLVHHTTIPFASYDPNAGFPYYNPPVSVVKSIDYSHVESEVSSDGNDIKRPTPIAGNVLYILYYNELVAVRGTLSGNLNTNASTQVKSAPKTNTSLEPQNNKSHLPGALSVENTRQELEKRVQEWMDLGHLAPTAYYIGLGATPLIFFTTPSETLYTLSSAYPYLSTALKSRVKQYLDAEMLTYPPLTQGYYPPTNGTMGDWVGTPREYFALNTQQTFNYYPGADVHPEVLYDIWVFSNNTGDWDYATAHYSEIKSIYTSLRNTGQITSYPELSGAIGFSRIAQHLGHTSDYDDATNFINGQTAAASDFTQFMMTAYNRFPNQSHGFTTPVFFYARTGFNMAVATHFDRDIGVFLADHAETAVASFANDIEQRVPLWWLTAGAFTQGENAYAPPEIGWTIFMLHAYVLNDGASQLQAYLDAPIRKGDLFYIQKLVAVVEATGKTIMKSASRQNATLGDVITYSLLVQDTGASPTQSVPLTINDSLPAGMVYNGGVCTSSWGAAPTCTDTTIHWQGTLSNTIPVEITYSVEITTAQPGNLTNQMQVDGGDWGIFTRTYTIMVNPIRVFIPLIKK